MKPGGAYHTPRIGHDTFYNYYLKLNQVELETIAHQPQDMIKDCKYGSGVVGGCMELVNGTTKMFSPLFGVCYMFNFKGASTDHKSITSIYGGAEWGLKLILDTERKYTWGGGYFTDNTHTYLLM